MLLPPGKKEATKNLHFFHFLAISPPIKAGSGQKMNFYTKIRMVSELPSKWYRLTPLLKPHLINESENNTSPNN